MMTEDFHRGPTAHEALEHWYEIKSILSPNASRFRLRKPNASLGDSVVDALADGIVSITSILEVPVGL